MTDARLFSDGEWVSPKLGGTFPTIDPSTEEPIAAVARGTAEDVARAVAAAARAMSGPWAAVSAAERGRLMFDLADRILGEREALALVETRDVGKPLAGSREDIDGVVATLRYNAGAADKMQMTWLGRGRLLRSPLALRRGGEPWKQVICRVGRVWQPSMSHLN